MSSTITIRPATQGRPRAHGRDAATSTARGVARRATTPCRGPPAVLGVPDVDFPEDVVVAESSDGSIVGYADVARPAATIWLDVRAIGARRAPGLLEAIERTRRREEAGRAAAWASCPTRTRPSASSTRQRATASFATRTGCEIELEEDPRGARVAGRLRRAHDARGRGAQVLRRSRWRRSPTHGCSAPSRTTHWRHWFVDEPSFDPSLWFVAEKGDELGGIVIARAPENEPGIGWVRILGVIPEHRRSGLGQALLRHTFRGVRAARLQRRRARRRRREPDRRRARLRAGRHARRADESDLREGRLMARIRKRVHAAERRSLFGFAEKG